MIHMSGLGSALPSIVLLWACLSGAPSAKAEDLILSPTLRAVPGEHAPAHMIRYRDPEATNVTIAGSWSHWLEKLHPLRKSGDIWEIDVRDMDLKFGQQTYKFIVNGEWESGSDRVLYVNEDGLLERPPDVITSATIMDETTIDLIIKGNVPVDGDIDVKLEPHVPIASLKKKQSRVDGFKHGYSLAGGIVTFYFAEDDYALNLPLNTKVAVAGNFNGWDGTGGGRWLLTDIDNDDIWQLSMPIEALRPPPDEHVLIFKFVINGKEWLAPPAGAFNATPDGKGHVNLRIDPEFGASTTLRIETEERLDISQNYVVVVEGLIDTVVKKMATPGELLYTMYSDKLLGVRLDRDQHATTYSLFAPRARSAHLCIFDGPEYEIEKKGKQKDVARPTPIEPAERYPMWRGEDGVWEISLLGLDVGTYYSFNVDGPEGDGEGFNPNAQIGDPYARAAAHAKNNSIVIDHKEQNAWFTGWTDQDYEIPNHEDVVIYETHVRHLTKHPSSGVDPQIAGKYEGILASEGTGTGLDHLKELGVNMIELLPVAEFNNGVDRHDWGYATAFFFSPEASYARAPLEGSQYYEFKHMVNELHNQGFGVILDVVYNHIGYPNVFSLIDRKYYFRLNPDYTFSNFSGVGNDVRSESLMMRRLIVDNILYWMREHHVDGFRFDLAELIDMETMMAIRDAARAENPKVLLISEPWSFRGENKHLLTGTGWAAWNNTFRYAAKHFVMGERNRDELAQTIEGSGKIWTANPLQTVNYVESHDDMSLADELSTRPDRDGSHLQERDVAANRLAATIVFTSLGIPMLAEGQEFLRSKKGVSNTYNKGDRLNALNWKDRERPMAAEALAYYKGLVQLRQSDDGAAFRVASRPPDGYYQWIKPAHEQALGYVVNAGHIHAGASFVVLLNASGQTVNFDVPFPPGQWRMIGNGEEIDPAGLPRAPVEQGGRNIRVPVSGVRAVIFKDGF